MRVMRRRCCWMQQLLSCGVFLPSGGADGHLFNIYADILNLIKGGFNTLNNLTDHSEQKIKESPSAIG